MGEINLVAKQINTKVHDQRTDLVEVVENTHIALENAEEAEENIVAAEEDQKSTGKCMTWIWLVLAAIAIIVIIIVVLQFV